MRRRMSGSFSSSMNGPVFVSLHARGSVNQFKSKIKKIEAYMEKTMTSTDQLSTSWLYPLMLFRLIDIFWCEVT